MNAQLAARVAALPCWRGPVTLEPLRGGLSNTSFIVDAGGSRYVARCGGDIPAHGVSRERERAISIAAHAAGLSPELVYAEPGVMVLRYVTGRTLIESEVAANLDRVVALLQGCHRTLPRHLRTPISTFWVFDVIRDYVRMLDEVGEHDDAELARYAALAGALEDVQVPLPIVFGHHDLLPGNFLDDGQRLWLIDWEYGGYGTAMFDLANVASNGNFSPADDRRLLERYFDDAPREPVQRAFDAMKIASALREALWAIVSGVHLAIPDVDYEGHAERYFARTEELLHRFESRHGRVLGR
jgi:thiamine kinase-like enzyme